MSKTSKKKSNKTGSRSLPREVYEAELFRLQAELVKLQQWTQATGARVVVIGRASCRERVSTIV